MDPIHDVGPTGWPRPGEQSQGMTSGRVVSLAGRSLCIEATSERAQSAIVPAIAHLAASRAPTAGKRGGRSSRRMTRGVRAHSRALAPIGSEAGGLQSCKTIPRASSLTVPKWESSCAPRRPRSQREICAPTRRAYALAAWLAGPSTQVLHAGAVAYEGAAALIVGASGAGKSTTVLACAMAGAGFLGDDLVLVESGSDNENAEPTVHCLFATAKLNADSARALGAEAWPSLGVTPKNKAVVAVRQRLHGS